MSIDVIIPVYKPDKSLFTLIEKLESQTLVPDTIILMNTEEKYFQKLVYGTRFLEKHRQVKVYHVSKREFDHGRTRRAGVKKSQADIFVMMTQDAMPADETVLEKLASQLTGKVAVAYARQLPAEDCNVLERYSRGLNYPEKSCHKSFQDLPELGIKTYFCSNVCAAYRRELYEKLGGFVKRTIFNEDMIYAAAAVKAGYQIAYVAEARVIHSHNYNNMQQLRRNFDLGVSQAEHPEVFADVPSEGEGKKLVMNMAGYLWRSRQKRMLPGLVVQSGCKYAGYLLGKNYRRLPRRWVLRLTGSREYFQ